MQKRTRKQSFHVTAEVSEQFTFLTDANWSPERNRQRCLNFSDFTEICCENLNFYEITNFAGGLFSYPERVCYFGNTSEVVGMKSESK